MPKLSEFDLRPGDWVIVPDCNMDFTCLLCERVTKGGWRAEILNDIIADKVLNGFSHLSDDSEVIKAYRPTYDISDLHMKELNHPIPGMLFTPLHPRKAEEPILSPMEAQIEAGKWKARAEAAEKEVEDLKVELKQIRATAVRNYAMIKEARKALNTGRGDDDGK